MSFTEALLFSLNRSQSAKKTNDDLTQFLSVIESDLVWIGCYSDNKELFNHENFMRDGTDGPALVQPFLGDSWVQTWDPKGCLLHSSFHLTFTMVVNYFRTKWYVDT